MFFSAPGKIQDEVKEPLHLFWQRQRLPGRWGRQRVLLAVDRALTPQHGNIIIISVDDELVMRRLLLLPSPELQELNGDGTLTLVAVDQDMPVWGVVSYAVTDLGLKHGPQE